MEKLGEDRTSGFLSRTRNKQFPAVRRDRRPEISKGCVLSETGGPFARLPLSHVLERRWLHYAFITVDQKQALIANLAILGSDDGADPTRTTVLLAYHRDHGWNCSQWHARLARPPWTSYGSRPATIFPREPDLELQSLAGTPSVSLHLTSTTTPAPAGVSHFNGSNWKRWQAQPGVLANGRWDDGMVPASEKAAVGYHERVHGCWAWPEMGGWVFGFCNELDDPADGPPNWALVFALLQPQDQISETTAMVMLWRRGRMVLFVPRRTLRVSAAGQLPRDRVVATPTLAALLGTFPTAPIPAVLCLDGYQGRDSIQIRFRCRDAARLVVPSETSLQPFSVHEVIGDMEVRIKLRNSSALFTSPGIVEFAGGASERSWSALR
jgi:hypothetical protein